MSFQAGGPCIQSGAVGSHVGGVIVDSQGGNTVETYNGRVVGATIAPQPAPPPPAPQAAPPPGVPPPTPLDQVLMPLHHPAIPLCQQFLFAVQGGADIYKAVCNYINGHADFSAPVTGGVAGASSVGVAINASGSNVFSILPGSSLGRSYSGVFTPALSPKAFKAARLSGTFICNPALLNTDPNCFFVHAIDRYFVTQFFNSSSVIGVHFVQLPMSGFIPYVNMGGGYGSFQ